MSVMIKKVTEHMKNELIKYCYPGRDASVLLSITDKCQCKCRHCGVVGEPVNGGVELTPGEINDVIRQLSYLGVKKVIFFGGEPLLVPELAKYIADAKQYGLEARLDTNGLLLSKEKARELKEAGLDSAGISIDSAEEAKHDASRGVKGVFKKAMEAIANAKQCSLNVFISTYATKEKLANGDIASIVFLAKQQGVKLRILSPICSGRWSKKVGVSLGAEDIDRLRSFLKKNKVYWEIEDIDDRKAPFICRCLTKDLFYISAIGELQPCCYIQSSFGNVRSAKIKTILRRMWRSDLFSAVVDVIDCPANSKELRALLK